MSTQKLCINKDKSNRNFKGYQALRNREKGNYVIQESQLSTLNELTLGMYVDSARPSPVTLTCCSI
jgi:hypothetical protein